MNRVGILFSDFGPYHVARIEALGRSLREVRRELVAFRFTERSDTYGWDPVLPQGMETVTLAQRYPAGAADALQMAGRFRSELRARGVSAVFLPTYSPLPNLLCLLAAKSAGCRTILMTESWLGTERAGVLGRMAKHLLVRMFDSALVGGTPQRDFVVAYGMPRRKVFLGYDVVDVDFFAARADEVRAAAKEGGQSSVFSMQLEQETEGAPIVASDPSSFSPHLPALTSAIAALGLPDRFFLNLGRFVEKKNLSTLVAAYARYVRDTTAAPQTSGLRPQASLPALVLVGEGPLRGDLERQARELGLEVINRTDVGLSAVAAMSPSPIPARSDGVDTAATGADNCNLPTANSVDQHGTVVFYGFQQSDMTPVFFALCEAFILPSLREEWGLVVNEAMACGAPVIVSRNVGSARDLVADVDGPITKGRDERPRSSVLEPANDPADRPYPGGRTGGGDTAATEGTEPLEERPGFTFDPHNVAELAELLRHFAADPTLRGRMGAKGWEIIKDWGPDKFGEGGRMALEAAEGSGA